MVNLLLIDSSIKELDKFVVSINKDTSYVIYDAFNDNIELIKIKIAEMNITNFDSLGLVFMDHHNSKQIFINQNTFITERKYEIIENDTTNFLNELIITYKIKTLDFLACNLLSYPIWKKYFEFLIKQNNDLIIRASNDRTGNLKYGGDWIMETTNEDIKDLYFSDKINDWNGLLDLTNSDSTYLLTNESTNNLYMCGQNQYKQLGMDGSIISPITKLTTLSNKKIIKIEIGDVHSLIITDEPINNLYVAGSNEYGGLGLGITDRNYITTNFINVCLAENSILLNKKIVDIGLNYNSSFVVTDEEFNNLYVCGRNDRGILGIGDPEQYNRYFSYMNKKIDNTDIFTNIKIVNVSCGSGHVVVMTNDEINNIYVCGDNSSYSMNTTGQLGIGNGGSLYYNLFRNKKVDNSDIINKKVIKAVCGGNFTFILTDETFNNLYSTGMNTDGQLGLGTFTNVSLFTKVSNLPEHKIMDIKCGYEHSLLITNEPVTENNNNLYVCGYNGLGQLGLNDENYDSRNTFVNHGMITSELRGKTILSMMSGYYHSIVITNEPTDNAYSAGANSYGQLGSYFIGESGSARSLYFYKMSNSNTELATKKIISPIIIDGNQAYQTGVVEYNIPNECKIYFQYPYDESNGLSSTILSNSEINNIFGSTFSNQPNATALSLSPAGTTFTSYISFDIPVNSTIELEVWFITDGQNNPIQISAIDTGYGTYYSVNGKIVTIYTKHFSSVYVKWNDRSIPCLTEDTTVLTPQGYVKITELKEGEFVLTDDNKKSKIIKISKSIVDGNSDNFPYIIPKNSIYQDYPKITTILSGSHLIKTADNWIHPRLSNKFIQDTTSQKIKYYHIKLENYAEDNLVINDGLVVESLADTKEDTRLYKIRVNTFLAKDKSNIVFDNKRRSGIHIIKRW